MWGLGGEPLRGCGKVIQLAFRRPQQFKKKKKKLNKKKEKEVIQFFLVDMQFDFKSDV